MEVVVDPALPAEPIIHVIVGRVRIFRVDQVAGRVVVIVDRVDDRIVFIQPIFLPASG